MIQFDRIKKDIAEIKDPMEFAGFLDGIRFAAAIYCKENCPDEVTWENGKIEDITVYGMCQYLESKSD